MSIIKNFGFLWERKYINRGAGSNAGHLVGEAKGKPNADFSEQVGVYVLYDRNQLIVYVGQAGNGNATLFSRLKSHMEGALWNRWEYFSWVGFRDVTKNGTLAGWRLEDSQVSGFKYADALNEIEGILIEIIEPKLNKQGCKLKNATKYHQLVDERVQDITNKELFDELRDLNEKLRKSE